MCDQTQHHICDLVRIVRISTLDVDSRWDLNDACDRAYGVEQSRHRQFVAIAVTVCPRDTCAGRGDGAAAQRFHQSSGACIPGIGKQQQAIGIGRRKLHPACLGVGPLTVSVIVTGQR